LSSSSIFKVFVLFVGLILAWYLRDFIIIFILSFTLASFTQYLAGVLYSKYAISYWLTRLLVFVLITTTILATIALLFPIVITEGNTFLTFLIGFMEQFQGQFINLDLSLSLQVFQNISGLIPDIGQSVLGILGIFGQLLTYSVLILALAFYVIIDNTGFKVLVSLVVPVKLRENIPDIVDRIQNQVGRWAFEQIAIALIMGGFMYTILTISEIKYAAFLSILSAISILVPFIGPILIIFLIMMYALSQSVLLGLAVLFFIISIQIIKHTLLLPAIGNVSNKHNPLLLIIGITLGGLTSGVLGVIIAMPVISLVKIIYTEWISQL